MKSKNFKWIASMIVLSVGCLAGAPISVFADDSELCEAVKKNDATLVRACVDRGCDVDAPDSSGATPLYFAVTRGYGEIAEILIDAGADVNKEVTFVGPLSTTGYSLVAHALGIGHFL